MCCLTWASSLSTQHLLPCCWLLRWVRQHTQSLPERKSHFHLNRTCSERRCSQKTSDRIWSLGDHRNARHGMNLHPVLVVCFVDISSHNAYMRPHGRNLYWIVEARRARGNGIGLSDLEHA